MLTQKSSYSDVMQSIATIKLQSLNIITHKLSTNQNYLEPRELKILADTALSIEDSITDPDSQSEGEQARKMQRLLDKYGTPTSGEPSHIDNIIVQHQTIEHQDV